MVLPKQSRYLGELPRPSTAASGLSSNARAEAPAGGRARVTSVSPPQRHLRLPQPAEVSAGGGPAPQCSGQAGTRPVGSPAPRGGRARRGLGSAAPGASCSPSATPCGEAPGAGAPQPRLRPAPCPRHRHRHCPSCIPWLPRAVQGCPRGFHAAAQLALSKNKKTKARQILWSSFLTSPHRRLFLPFSLFFVQLVFALV